MDWGTWKRVGALTLPIALGVAYLLSPSGGVEGLDALRYYVAGVLVTLGSVLMWRRGS
jgi:hypothetical protein